MQDQCHCTREDLVLAQIVHAVRACSRTEAQMNTPDLLWLSFGSVIGSFGAYGVAYGVNAIERLARRRGAPASGVYPSAKNETPAADSADTT